MDITALVRTPILILALLLAVAACGPGKPVGPTPEEVKRQAEQAEQERLRTIEQERLAREEAARKAAEEERLAKEAVELPKAIDPKPPEPAALASEPVSAQEERLSVPTMPPQPPPTSTMTAAEAAAAAVAAAAASQAIVPGGPPAPASSVPAATPAPATASSTAATRSSTSSTVAPLIASSPARTSEAPTVPYDQAFPPIPDRLLRVAVISAPSQANVAERIGTMLGVTEKDRLESSLGMGLHIAYLSQSDRDPKKETRIQYREKYLQAAVRLASVIPQAQKVERMADAEANRMGVDVLIRVGADLR